MLESARVTPMYRDKYERAQAEAKRFEDWCKTAWREDPLPFSSRPRPGFPVGLLPDVVRDFVTAVAQAIATPVDLPAVVALAVLSTAAAKRVRVRVRAGWTEPVNLYEVLAMESGSGKSTAFSPLTDPIFRFQKEARREQAAELPRVRARRQAVEDQIQGVRRQIGRMGSKPAELTELNARLEELNVSLDALPMPVSPLFITEDATPEALATAIYEHGERMAVLSAEGGEVVEIMDGRYAKNPNIGIYLKAYTGDRTTILRRGREECLEQPILTLLLTVQPAVIPQMIKNEHFKERGLLGRVLYSIPQSTLGHREFSRPPVPPEARERYSTVVTQLMSMSETIELDVSNAALAELCAFHDSVEPRLDRHTGDLAYMQEWAARMPGFAVRIAGLLHVADCGGTEIQGTTMHRAVRLVQEYFLPHAQLAHEVVFLDERLAGAKDLLEVIRSKGWSLFTGRMLHQAVRGQTRFHKREPVTQALEVMEQRNYVKVIPGKKDEWMVHPRWLAGECAEESEDL